MDCSLLFPFANNRTERQAVMLIYANLISICAENCTRFVNFIEQDFWRVAARPSWDSDLYEGQSDSTKESNLYEHGGLLITKHHELCPIRYHRW
jgi:hypothetical protein